MKLSLKIISCLFSLTLAFGFSGCRDVKSAAMVVGSAGEAIRQNDFQGFRDLLAGNALKIYGEDASILDLQKKFLSRADQARILSLRETNRWANNDNHYSEYNVDVGTPNELFASLLVTCITRDQTQCKITDVLK
jgi:hypothetical protein